MERLAPQEAGGGDTSDHAGELTLRGRKHGNESETGGFEPIFRPSNPLDPKSDPKLAGIWIVKVDGKLTVLTDTGRGEPAMPLEPAATQP